jgi:hypothetical protein
MLRGGRGNVLPHGHKFVVPIHSTLRKTDVWRPLLLGAYARKGCMVTLTDGGRSDRQFLLEAPWPSVADAAAPPLAGSLRPDNGRLDVA